MRTNSVVRGGSSSLTLSRVRRSRIGCERLAQLAQVLVAQHLALLVDDAVLVEEAEAGPEPAVVDELHDRIQLVEPVFQRRAGQHQGESRLAGS